MGVTQFPIIAYFPSWTGSVEDVAFEKITHINYSFAMPTPAGGLTDIDAIRLHELVRRSHAAGVKAGLAVGGWNDGDCSAFEAMAADPKTRRLFIDNLLQACMQYDLDGIDIDWEYPKAGSAENFAALMIELRSTLGTSRLLSAAVIAEGDEYGIHIHPEVFARLDFLNVMAYDWLYQSPGTHHSPLSLAQSSLAYWLGRGCPPKKMVLGVPFYGRSHQATATYRELVGRDPKTPDQDRVGDILYNGRETMRQKARLAMKQAGGIMFWEITQDTRDETSLLTAIHATVMGSTRG